MVKEGEGRYSFLGRLVDVEQSGPMDQVISKSDFWMIEKAVFLACSNAWLGESVNGKLLAISEGQGRRGKKADDRSKLKNPFS